MVQDRSKDANHGPERLPTDLPWDGLWVGELSNKTKLIKKQLIDIK